MSITITLQTTENAKITAHNDILLKGAGVDFYLSSSHHARFWGYYQGDPGSVSGRIEVHCNTVNKKIFLTKYDDRIPLYWDPANVPLWVDGRYYSVGDKVQGDDSTANKHLYRCKVAHGGAAATRPPSGMYWDSYWDMRDDLDDGRKFVYINNYS